MNPFHRTAEGISSLIKAILLVEDDQDISLALSHVLEEETGYRVIVAADGFVALNIIRTVQPDLFVVDYQLPGMDGLELVDTLQAMPEWKPVPVLFMSACLPRSELAQRHLAYLEKPFELDAFVSRVKELLA